VERYAGIDVSLELSSVCVVDGRGKIVKEAEGRERAGSSCLFLQGTWLSSESDWAWGWAVIAMAACRADASGVLNRSAGDAACEGGIVGDGPATDHAAAAPPSSVMNSRRL